MWQNIGFVVVGLTAGVLSGVFGIGGGLLIIPVLVYVFGMTQHLAQGTGALLAFGVQQREVVERQMADDAPGCFS